MIKRRRKMSLHDQWKNDGASLKRIDESRVPPEDDRDDPDTCSRCGGKDFIQDAYHPRPHCTECGKVQEERNYA
jgi:ribosomal protein S27AE